jgi:cysteine-rich repeat protein
MRSSRSRTWNVTVGPDLCGNATLDAGETCDDGGVADGDGCSVTCAVEPCWRCTGQPSVCTPDDGAACSDGDACTAGETCAGGSCGGGMPVTACTSGEGCCPAACTFATDTDCPAPTRVSGKKLDVKDGSDPTKRSVAFDSRDPAIDTTQGSGIDPVANGLALQLYDTDGRGESVCLRLPSVAGSWRAKGDPASPVFSYADTRGVNGPCKHAVVKDGKLLKISCAAKLRPIGYSLDEPAQHALAVRVVSGSATYCALFGGTVKTDSGTDPPIAGGRGKFSARDAAAPAACPAPPAPCP